MAALKASETDLLVAQMRPALVKYFRRKCGGEAEAEDLAQDVLVRALGHAHWDSIEQAKGYIFRSAVNRWRDRQRRRAAHGITVQLNDELAFGDDILPDRVLTAEQELRWVTDALLELGERTRDLFVLIRLEQMRQAEIAALYGISVSAVEKHLARAIAHLARCAAREKDKP